ncbi:unnamed protein product [Natator depressus]
MAVATVMKINLECGDGTNTGKHYFSSICLQLNCFMLVILKTRTFQPNCQSKGCQSCILCSFVLQHYKTAEGMFIEEECCSAVVLLEIDWMQGCLLSLPGLLLPLKSFICVN